MNCDQQSSKTMRGIIASRHLWAIVSLFVILHVAIFDLRIIAASDTVQVQYTPDDAYYYLVLAKNFSNLGSWTFDSGLSTASGFHPLLAYLLSLLCVVLRPTTSEFVRYGLVFSSLITLATALFAWVFGLRKSKPYYYMLSLAVLISSKNYTYNSVSIVEWPLVVLFAALYCIYFYCSHNSTSKGDTVVLFLLGLIGSLSRSDFGLLPFSLFAANIVLHRSSRNTGAILASLSGLVGATLGVLLIFVHNQIFTGNFLQSSARMKAYWAQVYGSAYPRATNLVFNILGIDLFRSRLLAVILALLGILVLFMLFRSKMKSREVFQVFSSGVRGSNSLRELTLVFAASLCCVGYILFYAHNGTIQPWYTANLIVPVFIMLFTLVKCVDSRIHSSHRQFARLGMSIIVMLIVIRNIASVRYIGSSNSPWPHQQIMLDAGKYLGQQALDGRVGSWNAAIIGYYQGRTVINIDGLVNDEIYGYAVTNSLPSYLSQHGIRYVIDFENMLDDKKRRIRGGYDDVVFLDSLQPIKVFDAGEYAWKHMTLYRLSP